MATTKRSTTARKPRERWTLERTLEERAEIDYDKSTTPFADCHRRLYTRLVDELLCQSSHTLKTGVKLRAVDQTIEERGKRIARVRLFIYIQQ